MASDVPVEQSVDPARVSEDARALRTRTVRNVSLVLVLVGFAVLLYAMTVVRLIG